MMTTSQLPQILVRNAFNILGLPSSAPLKEIRKRSQQLLQLAKIDETPEFDSDIGSVKECRHENEIRLAVERVSSIRDRLQEFFFWFEDQKITDCISQENYQQALKSLGDRIKTDSGWLEKKDQALILIFQAFASSSIDSFYQSVELWKSIAESDEFWKFYEKHYLSSDELGTSAELFKEFRSTFFETLSEQAVAFYHQTKKPDAIGICYSAFGHIGKTAEKEVLQPLILKVKREIEALEQKLDSGLGVGPLEAALKSLNKYFDELDDFKLLGYAPLSVLKNHIAEQLRSFTVDIYNQNTNLDMTPYLNQISKLAISETLLEEIKADKKQLKDNEAWELVADRYNSIKDLIAEHKFEEAKNRYLQLDKELIAELPDLSESARRQLLLNYCSLLVEKGHELFDTHKFGIKIVGISEILNRKIQNESILIFEHVKAILQERLQLFHFEDPASDKMNLLQAIDSVSADLSQCKLSSLLDRHQAYLQVIEEISYQQPDEDTQTAIQLLGMAASFSISYKRSRKLYRQEIWTWASGIAIGLLYIIFFR